MTKSKIDPKFQEQATRASPKALSSHCITRVAVLTHSSAISSPLDKVLSSERA
jgi:hypothetical protein